MTDLMFVIARTASRRPTLQHVMARDGRTMCGLVVDQWSRAYQREAVPQILCIKCGKHVR